MKNNSKLYIDGIPFDFKGSVSYTVMFDYRFKTLYDVYKNPSEFKRSLYDRWSQWAFAKGGHVEVRRHSAQVFTLRGEIKWNGAKWYIEIYPTHNDIYVIDDTADGLIRE